ncbi:MAG: DUF4234 domain-containing protein [Clostridiales bacterium]|nr:DUF4234 domain-containing protein [Clostridiales bacterium]
MNNNPAIAPLKTDRSLAKFILLSLITFGIYGLVVMTEISTSINKIASPYDQKKTMHFCLLFFLIAPITLGIGSLVWSHNLSNRIGAELKRRGFNFEFSATTFWLWNILGSFIIVGPFIYSHKLLTAMNMLSDDYNKRG